MATRDLILNNFWWKITSLLLAVIVWFVVQRADSTETAIPRLMKTREFSHHPVSVMRDAADKRPIRVTPMEVKVTVSAPFIDATSLSEADVQTFVDFAEIDARQKRARIHVYLPRGVRLESIEPDEVTVEIIE